MIRSTPTEGQAPIRSSSLFARLALALVVGALAVSGAENARAVPIGPGCATCQGSVYDLRYDPAPVATTATTETWRIVLTVDTAAYAGPGAHLTDVAIKVSSSLLDATLVLAPGGTASWSPSSGGLDSSGCTGSGSGYACAGWGSAFSLAPAVPGGSYTWAFEVEIPTGRLFLAPGEASVKARYVNPAGSKVGALVSEGITLSVPEPLAPFLLLTAVLARRALQQRC